MKKQRTRPFFHEAESDIAVFSYNHHCCITVDIGKCMDPTQYLRKSESSFLRFSLFAAGPYYPDSDLGFQKEKIAFIFIAGTFLFYNPMRRWVNFSPQNENIKSMRDIKVLTFNVKYGDYGWDKVKKYIRNQNADIILVQEKDTNRALKYDMVKYPTVILKTKHRILRQAELIEDKSRGNSFYADIDINGKIVRVVNVYLEPFRLHKSMLEFNGFGKEGSKINALLSHMIPTFRAHEDQIRKIRKAVDYSPYPVILAGDFNSVPNSYEYYSLGKDLEDAFLKAGNGISTSFHDYKFPLRIDYIFTSKSIIPLSYKVDHSVELSDHYPVIAEFLLN